MRTSDDSNAGYYEARYCSYYIGGTLRTLELAHIDALRQERIRHKKPYDVNNKALASCMLCKMQFSAINTRLCPTCYRNWLLFTPIKED